MRSRPIVFKWMRVEVIDEEDGVARQAMAMVPHARFDNIAKSQFHDGGEYPMVVQEARLRASHDHYFAAIKDGFESLPEKVDVGYGIVRFKSTEHLRKWTLIETGWCKERDYEFVNEKMAKRFAAFFLEEVDEYARFKVDGRKLLIRTAQSQDHAHMDREAFEKSKKDVLDYIASLIGVPTSELRKNAGKAA